MSCFNITGWYEFMKWIVLLIITLLHIGCVVHHKVMVGDETVDVQYKAGKDKTFIHLHQIETTALTAAKIVARQQGASLIFLSHSGGRNIVFHLGEQRYEFDPNRMFTDLGIKKTLSHLSHYTPQAHKEVSKLANTLKQVLTQAPQGKIIAAHNNATYSLKDYLPGHGSAEDARSIYVDPKNYFRNFYLVTQLNDFLRLKAEGFNAVLQKTSAEDDGSLSIYLAHAVYANVEAGYDQLAEQIKMLQCA